MEAKGIVCVNCGESYMSHVGRSDSCPYDRHGEFDYRAKGLAWPKESTYFKASEPEESEMIRAFITDVAETVPQLKRGQVWCRTCGFTMRVDSELCMSQGWPKCCGHTMTIDSPQEQHRTTEERDEQ